MRKVWLLLGLAILLAALGGAGYWLWQKPTSPACTQEAKLCPDGSYVGRVGPNCEFAACPTPQQDEDRNPAFKGRVLAGDESPLLNFVESDYEAARETDKLIVLYFYANWCPICAEETANDLYPAFNELETDQVVGFRVNYRDSQTDKAEEDLAREFGISYQHTKIFIRNGQRVLKAPESWSKATYLAEIEKALKN
ncbi:MAG: thioredoxin family protein [Patescibacteria group bacterium]